MKEILDTILNSYLVPALATFITSFIAWIGTKIKSKYEEKVKDEQVQNIVEKVVKYVEQKYKDFDSSKKYNEALAKAQEWLNQKGIEVTDVELDTLIESSVYEITGAFYKKEQA